MTTLEKKLQALESQITRIQAKLSAAKTGGRKSTVKRAPTGLVTLVLRDETTKKPIHAFPDLDQKEFVNLRRCFYRVLVKKLGKDVKFRRIVQYADKTA